MYDTVYGFDVLQFLSENPHSYGEGDAIRPIPLLYTRWQSKAIQGAPMCIVALLFSGWCFDVYDG